MPEVDYFFLANNMQKNRQLSQQQQQIDMSQQRNDLLNEATRQEMSHMAQMNPLAVQARQFELEQAQAMGPLALRAANLQNKGYSADNAAKLAESEFQKKTLQDRLDAVASGTDLAQQQVVNAKLVPGQIEAQIGASNASASASNLAGQLTQDKRQALKSEQENAKGRQQTAQAIAAFDQYDKMKETNPEAAEEFKRQQFEASGLNPDTDIDQVRAAVDVQRNLLGEFKQVPGFPGLTFDERTGKHHLSQKTMQTAMDEKNKASAKGNMIRGEGLQKLTKDIKADIKENVGIIDAYSVIKELRKTDTPTDQLAAVIKIFKTLDPGSVVSQNEQGLVVKGNDAVTKLGALFYNFGTGDSITDAVFNNIEKTARTMAKEAHRSATESTKGMLDILADDEALSKRSYDGLMNLVPGLPKMDVSIGADKIQQAVQRRRNAQAQQSADQWTNDWNAQIAPTAPGGQQ